MSLPSEATGPPDHSTAAIDAESARRSIWRRWRLGGLLAHLALSLFFTWPLALNFLPGAGTSTPGTLIVDRDQNLWNLWWVRYALLHGQNPFTTDMIWYPTGVSLYFHTLNFFNGLLALPLLQFVSLPTVYNLIVLFSFVVGGYGAFLLVHYVCGNRWAALIGSVVFAYSAYHIATMRGLLQLISLEWAPFFVLFLLKAVYDLDWQTRRDVGRWLLRRALPAGFFLFLVSLVDWYYTMYSLMLAGFLGLYILVRGILSRGERPFWRSVAQPWLRIGVCLAIYLLLISPILAPTLRELRSTDYARPDPQEPVSFSADLLAFFQPPRFNRLWGHLFTNREEWPFASNRYEVYFTYTALFLSGVTLFATRSPRPHLITHHALSPQSSALSPGKWFWAASALAFFLLALGPVLQVNGQQVRWIFSPDLRLPMPYSLVESVPVLNISRSPDRFDMPLTLCLGVLSGYGANVLISAVAAKVTGGTPSRSTVPFPYASRITHHALAGMLLAVGAIALISLELAPMPYPQRPADVPEWYRQLGREAGDFSILQLPPQDQGYWHGAYRMRLQTAHEKPIFGGYISREYPHPFLESTPGYRELISPDGGADIFTKGQAEWLSAFALYRTRYVVLQKRNLPEGTPPRVDISPSRDAIRAVLGRDAAPVYEDEDVEVYSVAPPSERVAFLSLGEGWQPVEVGPNGALRWMGERATLRLDSPGKAGLVLRFRAAGVGPPRPLHVFHNGRKVFDEQVSALAEYATEPIDVAAGASTLVFASREGTVSPSELGVGDDPRQLGFAILDVKLERAER